MAKKLSNTPRPEHNPKAEAGDNSAAVEEANRVQLISLVSKLSATEVPIEEAAGILKAARKARSQIIGLAKAAGFPAWEMEARLAEMKRPSREMAEIEQRERKQRRWLGILDDEQSELLLGDKVPAEAKDEAHWAGEGLKAGLRQMSSTPPTECPAVHVQTFMRAHEKGLKEVLTANVPGAHRLSVRDQAAADFKEEHPEYEAGSPEAKKAEREAIAKAKASLEAMKPVVSVGGPDLVDGEFEMSDEEREAQKLRPSVPEGETVL